MAKNWKIEPGGVVVLTIDDEQAIIRIPHGARVEVEHTPGVKVEFPPGPKRCRKVAIASCKGSGRGV